MKKDNLFHSQKTIALYVSLCLALSIVLYVLIQDKSSFQEDSIGVIISILLSLIVLIIPGKVALCFETRILKSTRIVGAIILFIASHSFL